MSRNTTCTPDIFVCTANKRRVQAVCIRSIFGYLGIRIGEANHPGPDWFDIGDYPGEMGDGRIHNNTVDGNTGVFTRPLPPLVTHPRNGGRLSFRDDLMAIANIAGLWAQELLDFYYHCVANGMSGDTYELRKARFENRVDTSQETYLRQLEAITLAVITLRMNLARNTLHQ